MRECKIARGDKERVYETAHSWCMGMCVTKDVFEKQLMYFSDNYKSILLRDYITNSKLHKSNDNYVSLTFDDGYKDILTISRPYLDKYKIKSTIFICGHILESDNNFWWDVLIHSFAHTKYPTLDLSEYELGLSSNIISLDNENKRTNLIELVKKLWEIKDINKINEIALFVQTQLTGSGNTVDKLDEEDIITLHKSGYEIAAHTMTHPNLKLLSSKEQIKEISNSKSILEEIIQDKVYGFAYPAGFSNEHTEAIVESCGFEYAAGTVSGVNRSINHYAIERVGMPQSTVPDIKRCIYNYCKQ